jgi:hypothetical protein
MKKKILILLSATACLTFVSLFFLTKESGLKDLVDVLENVEALAEGEGSGGMYCIGTGSIVCQGIRVEMKITGFSI